MTEAKELEKRVAELEKRVAELEGGTKTKKKRSGEPRAPTEYNLFMKKKYAELKESKPNITHTERFAECAKAWKSK